MPLLMKTCPVCKNAFMTTVERKKYCSYACRDKRKALIFNKSLYKLSVEEMALRKELMKA